MIFEKVRAILCEQLGLEESAVTMDSNIADDLGADSLDVVDLIMSLEDEFGIEFSDDCVNSIKTVANLVKYIEDNQ